MNRAAKAADGGLALVLTGGGARAAYQAGFLRALARGMPDLAPPIVTGVSAGAINASFVAARPGSLQDATERLHALWAHLRPQRVFHAGAFPLLGNALRWGIRLASGGRFGASPRSLVDTSPLQALLERELSAVDGEVHGIGANIESGRLRAFALSTYKYDTGQTVTWIQGEDLREWERVTRLGRNCRITVRHVMASSALPLIFPAVRLGNSWYGDGGIRMSSPLAPAIHLGADRILALSTRYARTREEAERPVIAGYPPAAQVAGSLLNSIFLDAIDQDAQHLERTNKLLRHCSESERSGMRPLKLMVLRPSRDLGRLAADFEPRLPRALRFLTRGLGTRETKSPDFLSLLMFEKDYLRQLIEIGEEDAEAQMNEIRELLG